MTFRSVLIAGSTGLVGRSCMTRLLADPNFARVVVLSRRPLPPQIRRFDTSAKIEEHVVDFDTVSPTRRASLFDVEAVICCLGTTIKKAGSKERFRQVDYGYPKLLAEIACNRGLRTTFWSALWADPQSRIFYTRVKGEVEAAVLELPFPGIAILRPSFLLGERSDFRAGEEIVRLLRGLRISRADADARFSIVHRLRPHRCCQPAFPRKYRPISADDVAAVLSHRAGIENPGRRVVESAEIRTIAREIDRGSASK